MRYVLYLVLAIIVVALIAAGVYVVTGSGGSEDPGGATTGLTDQSQIAEKALAYVQPPYADDYGMLRLAGYLDNLSDQTIVLAKLEFQLTDDDGNRKELISYELKDIAPKSRKTYDANGGSIPPQRLVQIKVVELQMAD